MQDVVLESSIRREKRAVWQVSTLTLREATPALGGCPASIIFHVWASNAGALFLIKGPCCKKKALRKNAGKSRGFTLGFAVSGAFGTAAQDYEEIN
jgi:hypothetical protein